MAPRRLRTAKAMALRTLALGALVMTPLLTGCLTAPLQPQGVLVLLPGATPLPRLRCPGGLDSCNLLATLEPERQGNEVTIAVNPTDPDNVVAGAKDYYPESAGQCVWNGVYHTKDGATFASKSLPGSPWLLTTNPGAFEPNLMSQYWCATDPVVAFGPDGTFYYSILAYQGDPVTASKLGKDQLGTGVNDFAFNRVSQVVAVSTDGGATFGSFKVVDSGTFPVNFHDRQWIEVDQRNGNVYVAWTSGILEGNILWRSTDKGATWQGPVFLHGGPGGFGAGGLYVAVANGGEVIVGGCGGEGPAVSVSADEGATFTGFQTFAQRTDEGMDAEYRGGGVCMVAADDTDGPYAGNVYMVWTDTSQGSRDIYFKAAPVSHFLGGEVSAQSHGSGMEPIKLNDNLDDSDQFMPAISVNPTGVIDVAWWDRRNDLETNRLLDIYHTYSRDGGRTWSPDFRVTEVSSDPKWSLHQGGFVFIGDYIDIDSSVACAWPVWVDTRHEKADVMTSCVERPGDVA